LFLHPLNTCQGRAVLTEKEIGRTRRKTPLQYYFQKKLYHSSYNYIQLKSKSKHEISYAAGRIHSLHQLKNKVLKLIYSITIDFLPFFISVYGNRFFYDFFSTSRNTVQRGGNRKCNKVVGTAEFTPRITATKRVYTPTHHIYAPSDPVIASCAHIPDPTHKHNLAPPYACQHCLSGRETSR
jgi:hypothetical protein